MTITDIIDVYYYWFDVEQVSDQRGLAQLNGRALASDARGTGMTTQIFQSLKVL